MEFAIQALATQLFPGGQIIEQISVPAGASQVPPFSSRVNLHCFTPTPHSTPQDPQDLPALHRGGADDGVQFVTQALLEIQPVPRLLHVCVV